MAKTEGSSSGWNESAQGGLLVAAVEDVMQEGYLASGFCSQSPLTVESLDPGGLSAPRPIDQETPPQNGVTELQMTPPAHDHHGLRSLLSCAPSCIIASPRRLPRQQHPSVPLAFCPTPAHRLCAGIQSGTTAPDSPIAAYPRTVLPPPYENKK